MRKLAFLLLLVIALGFSKPGVVMAFFQAGGTMLVVLLLVGGVLFWVERARRC